MKYFSDVEKGTRERTTEFISAKVWLGITSTINSLIERGAFGLRFPQPCPDGNCVVGTDTGSFGSTLEAAIPGMKYPFQDSVLNAWDTDAPPFPPENLSIVDLVQFAYEHVAKPVTGEYHSFYSHHHLSFDKDSGRALFREEINQMFSRNGIAFELQESGNVIRLTNEVLSESLSRTRFHTKDPTLNDMLEDARKKFLNPDEKVRRESLEKLWDAWERMKTVLAPEDKKQSAKQLLNKTTSDPNIRKMLEDESSSLTEIGNTFQIRHSEVGQTRIEDTNQIDYLFHRLFSLIQLLIRGL